jgi:calcium-dependent protein kinase
MLITDRRKRIKTSKILEHKWFNQLKVESSHSENIDNEVIDSLKKFKGQSVLKKAALNVLVKMLKPKDIEHLKQEFMKVDTDNSGFIEYTELEKAIKAADFKMTEAELKKIIREIDYAENQKINYTEFLAATIHVQEFLTKERLEAIF